MSAELITLLTAVSLVTAVITGIIMLWIKWPKSEPRRLPSLEAHFATRSQLERTDKHVRDLAETTDQRFAAMSRASSEGREKIYTRLGAVEKLLASQGNEDANLGMRLSRMESKLDTLLLRQNKDPQ